MVQKTQVKAFLYRRRLNAQGYTSAGYYFGTGAPLYCVELYEDNLEGMFLCSTYVRGMTRDKVKAAARQEFPHYVLKFQR